MFFTKAHLSLIAMSLLVSVNLSWQQGRMFAQNSPSKYSPALSFDGKYISYVTEGPDDSALYVMNADGTRARRLIKLPVYTDQATLWSPDSRQIAFVVSGSNTREVDLINSDGSNKRKLSHGETADDKPAWSPNGKQIAFTAKQGDYQYICLVNSDGSNLTVLTKDSSNNAKPAWSPDGKQIAFTSDRDGNMQIYLMDADGSNTHRLIITNSQDSQPVWSPDGTSIAFVSSSNPGSKWFLRVVMLKGAQTTIASEDVQTDGSIAEFKPVWSPDGLWIAAPITYGMSAHIWLVNTRSFDTLDLFALDQPLFGRFSEARNDSPSWMPDGERFIFSSDASGNSEVYSVARDGTNVMQLTGN